MSAAPDHCVVCGCHVAGQALGACGCEPAHNCIPVGFDQFGPMVLHDGHRCDILPDDHRLRWFRFECECGASYGGLTYDQARELAQLHQSRYEALIVI